TAVATQLMVAPGIHGLAALRLAHAFLVGRQDLSLSDTANDAARRLWEAVGGSTSYVHSLQWHFALRPVGAATSADAGSRVMRLAARGLRRLWDLADFAITAVSKSDHRRPPPGEAVVVSPKVLVPHVPEVLSWCPLRPVYE